MASSRVQPSETCVVEIDTISMQPTLSDGSSIETIQKEGIVNGELLKAIEGVYRPVLQLMKLLGAYFGDTTFNRLAHKAGPWRKESCIPRFYCCLVVAGVWLNFAKAVVSFFYGGDIYLLLLFTAWSLLVALNGTTFLIVLPLTHTRKSRFENFLRTISTIHPEKVYLEKVKAKARIHIIIFITVFLVTVTCVIIGNLILGLNLDHLEPWNQMWSGLRIIYLIFMAFGSAYWLLPFPFFCITCLLLEALFDSLHKQISLLHSRSIDVANMKKKHRKLCEVVQLADQILSALLLEIFAFLMPVTCFNFYQLVNLPDHNKLVSLVVVLFWLLSHSAMLAIITTFGSRVSEKVSYALFR